MSSEQAAIITLHYITLHYITLHYITLHYITSEQAAISGERASLITAEQRQRHLLALLLPRGLHSHCAAAGAAQRPGEATDATHIRNMLHATIGALLECYASRGMQQLAQSIGTATISSNEPQVTDQVAAQWVQLGLVEDLKQAAGLGSQQAPVGLMQMAVFVECSRPAAPCAVMDCLLEQPQQLERFLVRLLARWQML